MTWNGETVRRLVGTVLTVIVSFEVVGSFFAFSEAFHDGFEFKYGAANLTGWTIAVAPMGFSLFSVPVLAGALCWLRTGTEPPTGFQLMLSAGVAAVGWLGFTIALQVYRSVMAVNGHRDPTLTMWVANLGVSALLAWLIWRELRKESAG